MAEYSLDEIGPPTGQQAAPQTGAPQTFSLDDVAPPDNHPALQGQQQTNWSDVPGQAAQNAPASAGRLLGNTYQAVRHPVDTATALGHTIRGGAQEAADWLGLNPGSTKTADEKQFDTVKDFYASRYGSAEGFKKALATDPAGVLADASSVLIGGEAAVAKLPGLAGKAGEVAGTVGRNINPLNAPINAANAGIRGINNGVNAVRRMTTAETPEVSAANYVAARTPPEALDAHAQATQGKPAIAAEATRQGITGMRALGLRQGATGDALGPMLAERAEGAPGRVMDDFQNATGISPHAALGDIQTVVSKGREAAGPLYDKVFDQHGTGAFISPLESQFTQHSDQVAQARHALTLATAKLSAAGDDAPASLFRTQEAAQSTYNKALTTKNATNARLQQAYEDEENGVQGGVWSPRIQQFLDDKEFRGLLGQGLAIQKREALAKGVPFNPRDYAVTGFEADGVTPIVSGVPNMRLLDAGKRGYDALINQHLDQFGRLQMNENVHSIIDAKNAYLKELDSLSPDYGKARAVASDYLGAKSAFDQGTKMFSNPNVTAKEFADKFGALEGTDAEAFKGGPANWLFNKAQNAALSGKMFDKPIMRQKLATIIGDPDKADAFLAKMKAESDMAKSGARMAPGVNSTTFESGEAAADQDRTGAAMDALHAVKHLATGRWLRAGQSAAASAQKMGAFRQAPGMPVPVRDEAGRLWQMPPADLAAHLRNMPPAPPPPPPRGLVPQGARTGLLGAYQLGNAAGQTPYRRGGFV